MPTDTAQSIKQPAGQTAGVTTVRGLRTYTHDLVAAGTLPAGGMKPPTKNEPQSKNSTTPHIPTYAPQKSPAPITLSPQTPREIPVPRKKDRAVPPPITAPIKTPVATVPKPPKIPVSPKPPVAPVSKSPKQNTLPKQKPTAETKQPLPPTPLAHHAPKEKKREDAKTVAKPIKKIVATQQPVQQTKPAEKEKEKEKEKPPVVLSITDKLRKEIKGIETKKADFEKKLSAALEEKKRRENAVHRFSNEKVEIANRLKPIVEHENIIETEVEAIETKEEAAATTNPAERRKIEQERWRVEDERRKIEEERWEIEQEFKKASEQLDDNNIALQKAVALKHSLETQIAQFEKEIARKGFEIELDSVSKRKDELETQWLILMQEKERLEGALEPVVEHEQHMRAQKREADKHERATTNPAERRKIEQERWRIEGERRKIEEERWGIEVRIKNEVEKMEQLRPTYQAAMKKSEELEREIARLK